jgi:hypothetical protein
VKHETKLIHAFKFNYKREIHMRARKLKIKHIADTRTGCENLVKDTEAAISKLSNDIVVTNSGVEETRFPDFRCEIYMSKVKRITWKRYYQTINSVKAVPFDFV